MGAENLEKFNPQRGHNINNKKLAAVIQLHEILSNEKLDLSEKQ